ncbi:aspartate-rich protein 1 isoform X1 [Nomascus leucogenys]|uniref:aspartate-rich protein 1 isoform X1 n=1 Tax=Nomascus leucogenys TaxID=61853 RepID=UPI00122DC36F|nr:aspartate-rich protein 1 isoform X1 [Nomascus leucogenys]
MGNILTSCVSSICGWRRQKVAPCVESDTYEAVAAATSESTNVEPGKLDVGATEGQDLQHISNQKMPTGPPEDRLSLKFLPPSEEDNDDAKILPSPVQGSAEDNLSLVCPLPSEDRDGDHDEVQILPSLVRGGCYQFDSSSCSSVDNLSLVCLPPSEDDDLDDDDDEDDAQILPSRVQLEMGSEDVLFVRCSPGCKDDDEDDAHITAQKESDLTLENLSDEEIHPE